MAKITIYFKTGARIGIDLIPASATRLVNRYNAYLNSREQKAFRFSIEGEGAGLIAMDFEQIAGMYAELALESSTDQPQDDWPVDPSVGA